MDYLLHLVREAFEQHTELLLFSMVLLEQIGLPVPAYASLIVAGALQLTMTDAGFLCRLVGMAVLACILADMAWYWVGHRYGSALTQKICRLSMSPEVCVMRSARFYEKYGVRSLLIAKFLPGAGAMSTLLAGTNKTGLRQFLAYDAAGSMVWAGSALALGHLFQETVSKTIALLRPFAYLGAGMAILVLLGFIVVRWHARPQARTIIKLSPIMDVSTLLDVRADEEP